MARRIFSPSENEAMLSLPEAQRLPAFYQPWTRKEAIAKARGDGFAINRPSPSTTQDHRLFDLSMAPDWGCALCVFATDAEPTLHVKSWP